MFGVALKVLRSNLSRFVATLIAIAVGVGFLTASSMVTNSIQNSLGGEVDRQYAGVDAAVELKANDENRRQRLSNVGIPADQLDAVRGVDGVAAAAGIVEGLTRFVRPAPKTTSNTLLDFGWGVHAWTDDKALEPLDLVSGRGPKAKGEITVDRGTAGDLSLHPGSKVQLATSAGPVDGEVVGITRFGTTNSADLTGTVTAAEPWVFTLAGFSTPQYSQLVVRAEKGTTPAVLEQRLNRVIGPGLKAVTGTEFRKELRSNTDEFLGFLRPALLGFAGLALFVCCFVIYNTFSVVVGQRVRELALMRAVAATPRQVRRSLRIEGLAIGLLGSVMGIGFGVLITLLLSQILVWLKLDVPKADIALTPAIVVVGLLAGSLVTLLAVQVPAWRAGRTAPVEAMRDSILEPAGVGKIRLGFAVTMAVLGAVAMYSRNGILVALGAPILVIGVFLAGPALSYWLAHLARRPLAALGMSGRLSADNVARNPRRTSTTANALVIGLLLVTLVTVAGNSLKKATVDKINELSTADFTLFSPAGPIAPSVLDKVDHIDGVTTVARLRTYPVTEDGEGFLLASGDAKDLAAVGLGATQGALSRIGSGVAVVDIASAGNGGGGNGPSGFHRMGDLVNYVDPHGTKIPLKVTATVKFSIDAVRLGIVSPETFDRLAPETGVTEVLIRADRSHLAAVNTRLRAVTLGYGNIVVREGNQFGQLFESIFGFLINVVNGLLGMSVVVALIGIVNTLTLSIFERRRELGLLRAVGMTVTGVRRMIRLEALQMSLLGTTIGLASGLLLAWLLVRAGHFGGLDLQWTRMALLLGVGILIGVVAAIVPTRRVTKLDVLEAITVE